MFFLSGEYVTIRDAGFVKCNDDCCFVCLFGCFEDSFVNFGVGSFFFSRRMSRVHLVVNRLLSIVIVVTCSMRRLQMVFLTLTSCPSCFLLLFELSFFPFVKITRSEMELCVLFFVVVEAVIFLNNAIFSLVWLLGLFVSAIGFEFWGSS